MTPVAEGSIYETTSKGRAVLVAQLDFGYHGGRRIRRRRYVSCPDISGLSARAAERAYRAAWEQAEAKLAALRVERDGGLPANLERQTVGQYLETWLRDVVKMRRRPSTHTMYERQVRLHLTPAIGHVRLAQLRPQHVRALLNDLERAGKAGATVQTVRKVLHRAMEQACEDELIPRNPAANVAGPPAGTQERPMLSPAEARQLLAEVASDRLEALYVVTLGLGLRKGEALALAWSDIDLDRAELAVRFQLQRDAAGVLGRRELKTGRKGHRVVQLPGYVLSALQRRHAAQAIERELAGVDWVAADLVFTTRLGRPLIARNVDRTWFKHRKAAALPEGFRWHDLRHTTSSFLHALGVHERVRMEIMGHTKADTTMGVYTHTLPEMHRLAASRMDALLSGGDPGALFGAEGESSDS